MIEKIYEKNTDIPTINQIAAKLKQLGLKEELRNLAQFYKIPSSDLEAFTIGKRYFLLDGGDTDKEYPTVRNKLLDEMAILKDPVFADVIGNYLLEQYKKNPELEKQILQKHKTLQRCVEYLMNKAWDMIDDARKQDRINSGLAVRDDTVYLWVSEYYAEDDREKVNEVREKLQKTFSKKIKEYDGRKRTTSTNAVLKKKQQKRASSGQKAAPDTKPIESEEGKQLSLFDTGMNV